MTKKRPEDGFPHSPEPRQGAETKVRRREDGGVTVSFGDGSDDLDVSRREFMRLSGVAAATAAMSGGACIRNPVEYIVPYVDRPDETRIGQPNYYATVCNGCSAQCGMLVQTRGGRPIKVEGNPAHPVSKGALCARGQASYLNLYDPDRAEGPLEVVEGGAHHPVDWEELDRDVVAALEKAGKAGGVRLLTQTVTGSGRQALIDEIGDALNDFAHYTYEPVSSEALLRANETSYGSRHVPHYRFDKADFVVSLGSDFLGTWLSPVEFTRQFSRRRTPGEDMNRLVAFEGTMSVTGMNADDRHPVRPGDLPYVALALAHVVVVTRNTGDRQLAGALEAFTPENVAEYTGLDATVLEEVGQELADHAEKSLVIAGGLAGAIDDGVGLELAVNLLNEALGNEGETIERTRPSLQSRGQLGELKQLIDDINAGKVDVLIIDSANPIYSAPPELGVAEALDKVKFVVSTTNRVDETSLHARYLAPSGHSLERWGDSNPFEGVYTIQQPSITPLHDTRSLEASLITWFGEANITPRLQTFSKAPAPPPGNRGPDVPVDPGAWYRYLRDHWKSAIFPKAKSLSGFDEFWEATLRHGVFVVPGSERPAPRFRASATTSALPSALPEPHDEKNPGDLASKEVQLFAAIPLYDGEMANNGHLQELPDPVTKHVWGSYAQVSPTTFLEADLTQGEFLKVRIGDVEREFPVIMQPGLHDDVVALPLGYGRTSVGVVGDGVGVNTYEYTRVSDDRQIFAGLEASVSATGEGEKPAIVQGAQVIDLHRRPLFGSATLDAYQEDPSAGIHAHPPLRDMWAAHDYDPLKWGMSIDMTKCTGCNACVVACMEENNVPVVGKQGILEGREMHWLRIDRYYEVPHEAAGLQSDLDDDPMYHREPVVGFAEYMENPRVFNQPMLCQHCENAPCETVCPVSATMHSSDGLNQMAYNRCVGTRYCANNCPFKVRRFNWYSYNTDRSESVISRIYPELDTHARLNITEPLPMGMNPEVTVRSRGVMEKCTFCVQRIRRAKWQIQREGRREFRDGDVVTACQQACPADAIDFGNLLDENAKVARQHASPRASSPLEVIGVGSSIAYLTSVWNTEEKHEETGGGHGGEEGAPDESAH